MYLDPNLLSFSPFFLQSSTYKLFRLIHKERKEGRKEGRKGESFAIACNRSLVCALPFFFCNCASLVTIMQCCPSLCIISLDLRVRVRFRVRVRVRVKVSVKIRVRVRVGVRVRATFLIWKVCGTELC